MTPKFEIIPNHCERPADSCRDRGASRLGTAAQKAIGAGLQELYSEFQRSEIPEAFCALISELRSKETVFHG
jgi:hypothetical protein